MAGIIKIFEAQDKYKRVSRSIILNKDVDRFSLVVYVTMLTLGESWDLSLGGLANYLGISYRKVQTAFKVLEMHGYLKRTASRNDKGLFDGWDYEVYSEPTDCAKNGQSEKTDNPEKRTVRKNGLSENCAELTNRPNSILVDLNNKTSRLKESKFDFRSALISLGVSEAVADDWMQVRKARKAVNSETAFAEVKAQIERSGHPAEECIRFAAANSWRGFKASWMLKSLQEDSTTKSAPRNDNRKISLL